MKSLAFILQDHKLRILELFMDADFSVEPRNLLLNLLEVKLNEGQKRRNRNLNSI